MLGTPANFMISVHGNVRGNLLHDRTNYPNTKLHVQYKPPHNATDSQKLQIPCPRYSIQNIRTCYFFIQWYHILNVIYTDITKKKCHVLSFNIYWYFRKNYIKQIAFLKTTSVHPKRVSSRYHRMPHAEKALMPHRKDPKPWPKQNVQKGMIIYIQKIYENNDNVNICKYCWYYLYKYIQVIHYCILNAYIMSTSSLPQRCWRSNQDRKNTILSLGPPLRIPWQSSIKMIFQTVFLTQGFPSVWDHNRHIWKNMKNINLLLGNVVDDSITILLPSRNLFLDDPPVSFQSAFGISHIKVRHLFQHRLMFIKLVEAKIWERKGNDKECRQRYRIHLPQRNRHRDVWWIRVHI